MAIYDVDAGGLGDYSEIQDAIDAIPSTLTEDYTLNYRSSDGSAFTTLVNITKTVGIYSITVQAASGYEALKSGWDTGRARLENSTTASVFIIGSSNTTVDGLQISNTSNGTDAYCYRVQNSATNVRIQKTRMRLPQGNPDGLLCLGTTGNVFLDDFIIECTGIRGGGSEGIISFSANLKCTNGIVNNFNDGIEQESGTVTCVNVAAFNNVTDFDAVSTVDYCMTTAGTGTNAQTPSGGDKDNEFVDFDGYDYTALETGNLPNGVGPSVNSDVPTTDIEGDTRSGATAYIGVDEPSSGGGGTITADPGTFSLTGSDITLALDSSINAESGSFTLTGSDATLTYSGTPATIFSYAQINAGFTGFYDLVTDSNERRFNTNALWSGTITGTDASLKTNASNFPYIVFVDGVDSNPQVIGGEIELFSGLTDTAHDVSIFVRLAYEGAGNGLNVNETEILSVSGSAPAIVNLPSVYITDPSFGGQTTESTVATVGGNYTPTWEQSQTYDRERGEIIFNAQIDELYLFTDDVGVWLSIDNGTPVNVTFTETNTFSTVVQRRLAKVADGLDNTQVHQYTIWYESRVSFGIQGIVLKNNGALQTLASYTDKITTSQYGDSITYGSEGATEGEADTYLYGIELDLSVQKAGKNGQTTAGLTAEIPNIVSASFVPDWGILAIGRNDYANVAGFEADYDACLDALFAAGLTKIICRGITPNDSDDARIITMNSQIEAIVAARVEPDIYYVDPSSWKPISTTDGTHPTATGYEQLTVFEVPEFEAIIYPGETLTAEAGTFTLTGSDAALYIDRTLSAESGTYTLTGSSANLVWSGGGVDGIMCMTITALKPIIEISVEACE
jgi:lysophospholipase L1-like esterase